MTILPICVLTFIYQGAQTLNLKLKTINNSNRTLIFMVIEISANPDYLNDLRFNALLEC